MAATLALENLHYHDLPRALEVPLAIGVHGLAVGTAWARVEAGKHYPVDVLAGYAVGRFIGLFAHRAFMTDPGAASFAVQVQALPGGGVLTLSWTMHGPAQRR